MSNNGIAKNQHYVPRFLLENFANAKKLKRKGKKKEELYVHVFDKQDDREYGANIKGIAVENGFYDFQGEDGEEYTWEVGLSKLEGKASEIVRKIISEKTLANLSEEQKYKLAFFFAVQFVRTKHSREYFKDMVIKFSKAINSRFGDAHELFEEEDIEDTLSEESMKRYTAQSIHEASEYVQYFFGRIWALNEAPERTNFLIGDNPVALYNNLPGRFGMQNTGLAAKGVEVHIPISRKMEIVMLCPILIDEMVQKVKSSKAIFLLSNVKDQMAYKDLLETEKLLSELIAPDAKSIDPENVIHANYLQVKFANRFVYGSDNDFSLVKEMLADDDRYRTGPRGEVR